MQKHIKELHSEPRSFECTICNKKLSRTDGLIKHITSIHGEKIKNFECDICKRRFSEKNYLGKHVQSVHKRQGYV